MSNIQTTVKPTFHSIHSLAVVSFLTFCCDASAANLTWDTVAGDGATITVGGGTWNTAAVAWNNAGADVAWTQTNTTTAINSAIFAAADGAHAITVGASIAAQGIAFQNSGYTLSGASTQTITLNLSSPAITTTTGKTANIGNNLTISTTVASGNPITIAGGGTLNVTGAATKIQAGSNNITLSSGPILNLTGGASIISPGSLVVGTSTLNTVFTVDGGVVTTGISSGTGSQNIVIANAGTGIAATLTLKSGSVTNLGVNPGTTDSGLRFGASSGITGSVAANLNLDGGTLTVARVYEFTNAATLISMINLNGGTLKVTSGALNAANFMTGLDSVNVKEGGAVIDTNNVAATIAQSLLHGGAAPIDGGLTKKGLGTLTLTGANAYTGPTIINAGKIGITAPYNSVTDTTINANGRLRVTTAVTASAIPSITVNTDGGIEANVGTYTVGKLAGLSTATFVAAGNYKIDLAGSSVLIGDITVLSYTGKTGTGVPSLGSVPPGVTGTVEDTGSAIVIHVLTPQVPSLVWSAGTGDWDTTTSDWTGSTYSEGAVVTFPDLAGYNVVNLTTNRSPYTTSISNVSGNTYKLSGSSVAGFSTLTKSNTGASILASVNSYSGLTSVSAGGLLVGADNALGSTAGGTSVGNGAFLGLTGGISYAASEPVSGAGLGNLAAITTELNDNLLASETLAVQRGFIQSSSGNNSFAGPVEINATGINRIGVQDGAQLTLSGAVTNSTGVVGVIVLFRAGLNDGDFITLTNGANSWDGETRIFTNNSGTGAGLKLGIDNALPAPSTVVAGGGSSGSGNMLNLNGFDQSLNGLTNSNGTLHILNNGSSSSTLTLNPTADRDSFTILTTMTTIEDGTQKILLVKDGLFKQTLHGTHTYTGSTTINTGTLALNASGTIDNTESVTIGAGASFDVSAKTSYELPAGKAITLKIDGTAAGIAGKIKAAGLDISNASVVLDPVTTLDDAVYILAEYTAASLTGTQFASVNSISGYSIDYAYNGGTQMALVQDLAAGFVSWISKPEFSLAAIDQDPTDDPDNDGMENLLEFVLNGNPSISDPSIMPDVVVTATDFEFSYQRRDDSLNAETTQTFQYGTGLSDLAGWTDIVVSSGSETVGMATITVTDGTPADAVKISIPKSSVPPSTKLFGRLQVVKP